MPAVPRAAIPALSEPTRETQGLLGQAVLGPAMSKVVVYAVGDDRSQSVTDEITHISGDANPLGRREARAQSGITEEAG